MRNRPAAPTLILLVLLACLAIPALVQGQPQECKEAQESRSPQAQVDLFTICLDSPGLQGDERAQTYKQRAVAYMHLGRHQFALDDINQGMKLKPDDSDMYYLRGFAYRALGQHQKAIEDSNRAISMDPTFAAAYANRAFAYQALGEKSRAKSDAMRAKELDPSVKVPRL